MHAGVNYVSKVCGSAHSCGCVVNGAFARAILLPSACMRSEGTVVGSGCHLTSHFSNVCLSHKRYDLPNGQ